MGHDIEGFVGRLGANPGSGVAGGGVLDGAGEDDRVVVVSTPIRGTLNVDKSVLISDGNPEAGSMSDSLVDGRMGVIGSCCKRLEI